MDHLPRPSDDHGVRANVKQHLSFMLGGRPTVCGYRLPAPPMMLSLIALIALTAIDILDWWVYVSAPLGPIDFHVYWTAAKSAVAHGWSSPYDTQPFLQAQGAEGMPYANPPLMTWLLSLLTPIGYWPAFAIWELLSLASLIWAWFVLAPRGGDGRPLYLLAVFAVFPTAIALRQGQVVPMMMGVLAVAWWLLEQRRSMAAGLVLSLIAIKPQVLLLAPLLLVQRRDWRALIAFVLGIGAQAAFTIVSLGGAGVVAYFKNAAVINSWNPADSMSIAARYGIGPVYIAACALVAVSLLATARSDSGRESFPAACIVGGLVIAPYLHPYDTIMAFPAVWLALRADASFVPRLLVVSIVPALEFLNSSWTMWCVAMLLWLCTFAIPTAIRQRLALPVPRILYWGGPTALDSDIAPNQSRAT